MECFFISTLIIYASLSRLIQCQEERVTNQLKFDEVSTDVWIKDVRRVVSPNHDQRPENIEVDLLVIHGISLPPSRYGGSYIDQLFTNSLNPKEHPYFKGIEALRVSSHVLINRAGKLTQYVPFNKRAWHAGESEFCGRQSCNDFSIGIELEGCDDEPYEEAQYQTLSELTSLLMARWQGITKKRIVGHCHIAPGRKTDPGPYFKWDDYLQKIES